MTNERKQKLMKRIADEYGYHLDSDKVDMGAGAIDGRMFRALSAFCKIMRNSKYYYQTQIARDILSNIEANQKLTDEQNRIKLNNFVDQSKDYSEQELREQEWKYGGIKSHRRIFHDASFYWIGYKQPIAELFEQIGLWHPLQKKILDRTVTQEELEKGIREYGSSNVLTDEQWTEYKRQHLNSDEPRQGILQRLFFCFGGRK